MAWLWRSGPAAAAQIAEQAASFELRAEGSFPLQYIETVTETSLRHVLTGAPFLGLTATAHLQPDLSASIYTEAGHSTLGSFRDNDDTFASVGGNIVKRWGAFSAGVSFEHSRLYDGVFGGTDTIANDVDLSVRRVWRPDGDHRIVAGARVTARLDETFSAQRYSYGSRFDIERRLIGSWWAVAAARIRFSDYVGDDAGRWDTRLAVVGGLKYEFNDSVSARMVAGYEDRMSNVASRNSDKFSVGASLDFNIDLMRPRWPGGR